MADISDELDESSERLLRPLLPASRATPRSDFLPPAKRPRASTACSACRDRKSKCNAERPKCSQCSRRNTPCEYNDTSKPALYKKYEDLREQQNVYEELFGKLIDLPEKDSLDLLRRIRADSAGHLLAHSPRPQTDHSPSETNFDATHHKATKRKHEQVEQRSRNMTNLFSLLQYASEHGASELFRHIRQGMSPDNVSELTGEHISRKFPSSNQTNRNILPPTSTITEFQLVALHSSAYPALVPLDVASIDLGLLGISPFSTSLHGNPARRSNKNFVLERDGRFPPSPSSAVNRGDRVVGTGSNSTTQYIDARLEHIDVRRWTDVAITDDLAALAISLYLVNDTSWWAYFDIDLFLEDLVHGETRFCSRLLVNAVLSWACQAYAYYEATAFSLASKFLSEALRLHAAMRDIDCLTTIAATSLMCMTLTTLGKDKVGMELLAENASMAERLHLYNFTADSPPSLLNFQDDAWTSGAAATAWGSFNLQMLMSMSYHTAPFATSPPSLPIPGDLPAEGSRNRPLPHYQGKVYPSVCKLWSITFEMNYQYFHEDVFSLATAELIFQKLLAWVDDLPEDVKRKEHTPDGVVNLHIWFHTIVLDLFRPFADLKPQPKLTISSGSNATPTGLIEASINQLKRLIYTYRATSQSANYSIIWQSGMLYLVNHILHHYTNKEAHFYFLLCMRGYQKLGRTLPWIGGVVQGIAAMAVRLGTILPDDASMLFEEIQSEGRSINEYMSTYPVDLYRPTAESDAATLEHLVQEFRTLGDLESEQSELPEGWRGDSVALFTTLLAEDDDAAVTEQPTQE